MLTTATQNRRHPTHAWIIYP